MLFFPSPSIPHSACSCLQYDCFLSSNKPVLVSPTRAVCPGKLENILSSLHWHFVPFSTSQGHDGAGTISLRAHWFYFQMTELSVSILAPMKKKQKINDKIKF